PMLEPLPILRKAEALGNNALRLSLLEDIKFLPSDAVWNKYLLSSSCPADFDWMQEVAKYESEVLKNRL
ncbi:MAG TPA: L-rhamnose isomerase, partial [Spirochaetia bacterium]|nr:L-rhamnose isomerase [Spirochaetia bacterium]